MTKKYKNPDFLKETLMGPNAIMILEEMMKKLELYPQMKILDLGCGKGLTSMLLADETKATIFAMDLWISATENYERFKSFDLDKYIIPIHANANKMPFADNYFDAIISVDSYHYYGRDEKFMDTNIAPLVKKDGIIAVAIPGLIKEYDGEYPKEMLISWNADNLETMHSVDWWKNILLKSSTTELISIGELNCHEASWNDWLATDNEYAVGDRASMNAGAGKYMNLIFFIVKKK